MLVKYKKYIARQVYQESPWQQLCFYWAVVLRLYSLGGCMHAVVIHPLFCAAINIL